jgi:hypothetical protein
MRQLFSDPYKPRTEDKYTRTYILQEKRLVHTRGKGNMVMAYRGTRDYTARVHDRGIRLGNVRIKIDQKMGKNYFLWGEDFAMEIVV